MVENTPVLEEWRRLYDAAIAVKALAPWQWMAETEVFGVRDPETDELGFASVMGALGEHYSVAVYPGPDGLYGFWRFEDEGPSAPAESLVEIRHLQASFEDRNQLHDKDRQIIKKLGLKFRGRQAWPMFRSYRPGYFPWFLEAQEVRFLAAVLEQVLDVMPRCKENPALLEPSGEDDYLVRVPRQEDEGTFWEDTVLSIPPPGPQPIRLTMDFRALEKLRQTPLSRTDVQIDFFMWPTPVQDKRGDRPYFPYKLLLVEAHNGFVLGGELLEPAPSLEAMWGQIPSHVVQQFARIDMLPARVTVRSDLLFQILQPLAEELRFRLRQSNTLRQLDAAKEFMLQRFV